MHQLTVLIVDDEPDAVTLLTELMEDVQGIESVFACHSADEAYTSITERTPDLLFVDIEMPGKNGFDLVKELKHLDVQPGIIFTTAYNKYAIEAIRCAAFDYLLKPILPDDLEQAINRYRLEQRKESLAKQLEKIQCCLQAEKIQIFTRSGVHFIDPQQLLYCKADGNYTEIYLIDGTEITASLQLAKLFEQINIPALKRAGRSYLVNTSYLCKINRLRKTATLMAQGKTHVLKPGKSGIEDLLKA
jgi:two-component system, LytTR family, response regulator